VAIAFVIVVPGIIALGFQALAARSAPASRVRERLSASTVVAISVAVVMVLWSRVPGHLQELPELFRLVPLFFAFFVLMAPLGLLAGILTSLTPGEKRAIMIVGAGRGGVIMLPIAMALDQDTWGLIPLVVVVHLAIEILGMMVYRSIVPEIVPLDQP
jgi:ACR3 family arsenite efflux pump ArsB